MGSSFSAVDGSEAQTPNLKERVKSAQSAALSRSELNSLKDRHDAIVKAFLAEQIDGVEYQRQLKANEQESKAGHLTFESIAEFQAALELILENKEEIEDILEHENEHLSKALSLGLKACYALQFMKSDEVGKIRFYPSCDVQFPSGMPEADQRRFLLEIISAAHTLSFRDREQLGQK